MAKAHRSKNTLKSTLEQHKARLGKKKEELERASKQSAEREKQKKKKGKGKAVQRSPIIPFSITDRILLVGEGNFSFARSLFSHPVLRSLPPENVIATAYDSEEICYEKYPDAQEIVEGLRAKGVVVLFDIDATALEKYSVLKGTQWDRIVWNFPHAGKGIADQDRSILSNQVLLLGFLRSVSPFLAPGPPPSIRGRRKKKSDDDSDEEEQESGDEETHTLSTRGTVLVTLRNVPPYTLWDLPKLAKSPPTSHQDNPKYSILRSFQFHRESWPGYAHRMTKGFVEGTGTGADREKLSGKEAGEDRCWEFYLAPSE
ncbi:hypothetical protein SISNIDRAFT_77687 [Sistotremastrum niveocremeum HHB9708]|uniref:25S rRNA (uridine-N(3))-methyltransferase BMT5-like domain-containing protein n=2 Tax=Sistotremastraceae TaxID=3402574 RepID=A0A164UKP3_9AGAM|nr:hypothetical protein SISNIDRAFT_77687 [Sistotremastrum niveocremeum HHB9708]KZT43877.1 hypothetical protein SISSUDRAFT_1068720 [Sistotremastrum suecicum HHB10207 ss-3]